MIDEQVLYDDRSYSETHTEARSTGYSTSHRYVAAPRPTELTDPDSGEGVGWVPPGHDDPDHSLPLDDLPVQVFPNREAEYAAPDSPAELLFDPMITLADPDPESGYPAPGNPEEATHWNNPPQEVLPPGPDQLPQGALNPARDECTERQSAGCPAQL